MGKLSSSLDQNGSDPVVYVAYGRALRNHIYWCCGQKGVGMSVRVPTIGAGGSVMGLFLHCLSRQ